MKEDKIKILFLITFSLFTKRSILKTIKMFKQCVALARLLSISGCYSLNLDLGLPNVHHFTRFSACNKLGLVRGLLHLICGISVFTQELVCPISWRFFDRYSQPTAYNTLLDFVNLVFFYA